MLRLTRLLLLSALAAFAVGCGDDDLLNSSNLTPVTTGYGKTASITSLDLNVTFSSLIEDSRCPIGAYCFWPGVAKIEVRVINPAEDEFYVTLPIFGGSPTPDPNYAQPVDTAGYRFTLLNLEPYPHVDSGVIPPEDYQATILVVPYFPLDTIEGPIIISDLPPLTIQREEWIFDEAFVEGDELMLTVKYSGGCREHDFSVFMSPAVFLESFPAQANLYVRHESLDDPCDAIITENLTFSLKPVIDLYRSHYGMDDDILLNVYHYLDTQPWERTTVRYYAPESFGGK